ncbi:MAG: hypothetical protein J07HX64_02728 [halophilic archaeon J07HX64]|nr:MAG: hypothetical protein J07HX64_02728 [halophilic archaeon J07HX64]
MLTGPLPIRTGYGDGHGKKEVSLALAPTATFVSLLVGE